MFFIQPGAGKVAETSGSGSVWKSHPLRCWSAEA